MQSSGSIDSFREPKMPVTRWHDQVAVAKYLPAAALLTIGVAFQCLTVPNNDVAWLLTLAERFLGGARPDIDFIEFNPPASYLIYLPAAWVAHVFGVRSELVLIAIVAGCAALSTWAAGAILWRARLVERWQLPGMAFASMLALLIFSYSSFAQREHVALIALLPMLAVYASRARSAESSSWIAALSGVGGGLAICIKPYFALALLLPVLGVAWNRRHMRRGLATFFAPENCIAAFVVALYVACVLLFFPAFIERT